MAIDFPSSPAIGQQHPFTPVPGQPVYIWDGEKWIAAPLTGAVRYDAVQSLSGSQQAQARDNIAVNSSVANVVINGDFRVNQVGYVSAAVLNAGAYGHDQWKAGASGGNYSFTQLKSSTQITIASGKSLIQPIEDVNVVGGSYVLTWTGTAQARAGINTLTPSGAYAASPLSIVGQTAGTAMSIEFNTGTLGTVKFESGTGATPFVMRPYDQELVTCQRYFQWCRGWVGGFQQGANIVHVASALPTPMRASPTVNLINGTNAIHELGIGNKDIASIFGSSVSSDYGYIAFTTSTSTTIGRLAELHGNNSVNLDARL